MDIELIKKISALQAEIAAVKTRLTDLEDMRFVGEWCASEFSHQLPPVGHRVNIRSRIPERVVRTGNNFSGHEEALNRQIWEGIMTAIPRGFTWDQVIHVLRNSVDFAKHQRALGRDVPRQE